MSKMQEDLMRPAFNIPEGRGQLFNGGPLNNKVVRVPYGIDICKYSYMGHVHTYVINSTGAFYQGSEKLN